jgi:putative DNA-invertase from lambdoid prophage Rac
MATLRQAVLAKLKDRGVTGISSEVVSTILDAVAEVERERAAAVKADRKARDRFRGGTVPFGWRVGDGGELVEDAAEQAVVGRMRAMRVEGLSLRAICRELAGSGVTVSHVTVHRIVADIPPRTVLRGDGRRVQVSIPTD